MQPEPRRGKAMGDAFDRNGKSVVLCAFCERKGANRDLSDETTDYITYMSSWA